MKIEIFKPSQKHRSLKLICYIALFLGTTFLLTFLLLPQPQYTNGFSSLHDLQEYAKTLDEFRAMENKNFLNPTYEKYYQQKFTLTVAQKIEYKLDQILYFFHLKPQPTFSYSFFKSILEKVTAERLHQGWSHNFIQKINVTQASKLVVFGTVQGAFHPLVRYLSKLKDLNIIDENFKITNPNYYLVFLGNIVNRSPYTLEILTLVLKLLESNPKNVIYLKGVNENTYVWKSNTLNKELTMIAPQLSISTELLENEVSNFFDTLPITLYGSCPPGDNEKINLFKISPFIEDTKLQLMLQEDIYQNFLTAKNQQPLETFHLQKTAEHSNENIETNFTIKAILTDIKKRENYAEMDGLRLLTPTKGIITWTVLSTSAEAYRKVLKFFYDAFVIITPTDKLSDWKITLYNRDIRWNQDQHFDATPYYFFTGEKA